MSEKKEEKKKKKKMTILWLYVLILLIIIGLLFYLYFMRKRDDVKIELNVSDKQTALDTSAKFRVLNKEEEDEYIELVGYGLLEIDADYPYIYLENPSDNDAYLKFDVIYKGETLYSSDLVEPGHMETYNIYERLDAGQHTISYVISAYRMSSMKAYWTGVEQIQDIIIYK